MTGAGKGYRYPHDHGGWVEQEYLPNTLEGRRFFKPIRGREADLSRGTVEHSDDKRRDERGPAS